MVNMFNLQNWYSWLLLLVVMFIIAIALQNDDNKKGK